ncbi:Restriction endonuclease [Nostoc sp. PCC 7524]|uniref:restriction endonuclease n=1 Tax=Nostoc sp. (strain ATCC 29411 / PCC 7524) TaxID=28072 RepID=UPI00029F1636|nr:restriction endonuclease [Nostoc sp. PCC 7524]AFY46024.1 Restriction endonuclease [Nostoc sp. PCC 7524]
MSSLDESLRRFEAVEANLIKLEKLWNKLTKNLPSGIVFSSNPIYEDACRSYKHILKSLPSIDGWKPNSLPCDLHQIAQDRLNALEIGVDAPMARISVELEIEKPGKELREYRFRFNQKRRQLIYNQLLKLCNEIEQLLNNLQKNHPIDYEDEIDFDNEEDVDRWQKITKEKIDDPDWQTFCNIIKQIDVLLGSGMSRPKRWYDMQRHISYAQINDLKDIILFDWPSVKLGITQYLYTSEEPIPVNIEDLGELVASKPSGHVITKLNWNNLSAENFERLIFNLVSSEENYENVEWLMHPNAPDRGRDLSCYRVNQDRLGGVSRKRMIIQCKHWLSKGVNLSDISTVKDQIKLWEPPRVDILVIATTGRFTADAVSWVERHNQSDSCITIELWAETNLESILASNPALVAEFGLR